MPTEDRSMFLVKIELPTGSALAVNEAFSESIATKIRSIKGVKDTLVTIGGTSQCGNQPIRDPGQPGAQEEARVLPASTHGLRAQAIPGWTPRQDVNFAVEPLQMVGGGSSAFRSATLQFNVRGRDYAEISKATDALVAWMKSQPGFVDVDVSFRGGKPEVAINIDRDRAADLGVPVAAIASTVRSLMANDKVTEITADGQRWDVRLKLDEVFRQKAADLLAFKVRSTTGQLVSMSSVVSIADGTGPAKIDRQNRQRQITVYANLDGKALGQAVAETEAAAKTEVPAAMITDWAGMGDIMRESFGYLLGALLLAIIIVYLVLAAQFESFLHPFTIMLSLPLSMVGALGAIALAQQTISIMTMIGIILLMGLVTKNAILLVDYTNTLRRHGKNRREALLAAGPVRLRPILMTTGAMIFGMMPVALGLSEGSEMRAPMAIAVIGGLITSTMLTLVVIPVAYDIIDAIAERLLGHATVMHEGEETPLQAKAKGHVAAAHLSFSKSDAMLKRQGHGAAAERGQSRLAARAAKAQGFRLACTRAVQLGRGHAARGGEAAVGIAISDAGKRGAAGALDDVVLDRHGSIDHAPAGRASHIDASGDRVIPQGALRPAAVVTVPVRWLPLMTRVPPVSQPPAPQIAITPSSFGAGETDTS